MKAIHDLERLGYTFTLDGDQMRYSHDGDHPDPAQVRPLLDYVKQHRAEAVHFLQDRAALEAQANALLARMERGDIEAARQWAALHDLEGIPCFGFPSWTAWAEDVAALRQEVA